LPEAPFENPGGMWMPSQMPAHEATLRRLGVAFDPKLLSDPSSPLLASIVSLGGCSASFVSDEGLVITNHHCATGALSFNSTPQANLLRDGALARTRAEERSNGPEARVLVTQKLTDVSAKVLEGLDREADDLARYRRVEDRSKELVAACEAGRPELRCTLASYYAGTVYVLIEQLELRDVRLVYAPPAGVGNYGGEIDNWRWPRHTGDVSIFRAYVGKDGKPAAFSPANVPYRPAHHLKIATKPLRAGDFVMVAGYPGRTQSWRSGPEVDEAIGWSYPRRQRFCEDALATLEALGAASPEVKLKATPYVRRYGNGLTNTKGQLEGLVKGGLALRKTEDEAKLAAFISDEPARKARYGDVLGELRAAVADHAKTREADAQLRELLLPKLVSAAVTIVRTAKERERPDAQRHPDYQERNLARHEQELRALEKTYSRALDQGLLRMVLERIARAPEAERTVAARAVVGGATTASAAGAEKAIASLYAKTRLEDTEQRLRLLQRGRFQELRRSKDPLIALAVRLEPLLAVAEERGRERYAARHVRDRPWVLPQPRQAGLPAVHHAHRDAREGHPRRALRRPAGARRRGRREEARAVRRRAPRRRPGRFSRGSAHHRRQLGQRHARRARRAHGARVRRELRGDGRRLALHAGGHAQHPRRCPLRDVAARRGRRRRPPAARARRDAVDRVRPGRGPALSPRRRGP
jgi:hypothetical protein